MLGVWPLPPEQRIGLRAWGRGPTLATRSQNPGAGVASQRLAEHEIALGKKGPVVANYHLFCYSVGGVLRHRKTNVLADEKE